MIFGLVGLGLAVVGMIAAINTPSRHQFAGKTPLESEAGGGMKMSFRAYIAGLLLVMLIPCSIQARNLSDWSNVQRLDIGTGVAVQTKKGESFAGELKHVDNESLTLLVRYSKSARQAVELRRDDISQVRKKKSRTMSMILGGAIGLGVGIGIGAISDARHPYSDDPGIGKVIFGGLGMLLGTAGGSALPIKGKKIYVAP